MRKPRTRKRRNTHTKAHRAVSAEASAPMQPPRRAVAKEEGAQLVEFALVLPFLLVFVVGIVEFGGAFALKQKMANAAREGARIMVSNSLQSTNCSNTSTPCPVQWAAGAVSQYMTDDGVNSSCIAPGSPTSSGTDTWTYSCANGISLTINHNYTYYYTTSGGGSPVPYTGTQVTLTYPYSWFFNNIIKLLVPGSNPGLPTRLTESAVMQNIAN